MLVIITASIFCVHVASSAGQPTRAFASGASVTPAARDHAASLPVYHIPLRVHLKGSSRSAEDFAAILEEINYIWWSQAGICFEMQVVNNDAVSPSGFDIWFVPQINNNDAVNGYFTSGHAIYVRDTPLLNSASRPAHYSAARTAAHELGHALNLPHRQDSDDNLMRSKTYGWQLNEEEIAIARKAAAVRAMKNNETATCGPVKVKP